MFIMFSILPLSKFIDKLKLNLTLVVTVYLINLFSFFSRKKKKFLLIMAVEKKLTKRERKAEAFKKRSKKTLEFTEDTAVPESDIIEPEVQKEEKKVDDRKRKAPEENLDQKAVAINVPTEETEPLKKKTKKNDKQQSDVRYIVFIGNLPFTTTKEELQKHFSTVENIKSLRLLTDKATGKPKGFAFMEFTNSKDLNVSR